MLRDSLSAQWRRVLGDSECSAAAGCALEMQLVKGPEAGPVVAAIISFLLIGPAKKVVKECLKPLHKKHKKLLEMSQRGGNKAWENTVTYKTKWFVSYFCWMRCRCLGLTRVSPTQNRKCVLVCFEPRSE